MRQEGAGILSMTKISIERAIRHETKRAAEVIYKELEQMLEGKKVFAPVKRSDVSQGLIIRSQMFLKYKYDAQGKLEKLKARLVADDRAQDPDLYPNKYSPTASLEAIMATLKLTAVSRGLTLMQTSMRNFISNWIQSLKS